MKRWSRSDNASFPLISFNWTDNLFPPLTSCDEKYLDGVDVECSIGNLVSIANLGDNLNRMAGEVRISARHIQGIILGKRTDLVKGLDDVSHVDPRLVEQVKGFHTRGVTPVYRGGEPDRPRVRGFPYKPGQGFEIISKIWKDVRAGRILICTTRTITEHDKIVCTPSTLVTKKLPGRTLSTEMRLISDVRLVNNFCDKNDYPACENPTLADLVQRVEMLDRNFPGVPRRVTKRDVSEASKRVSTHPGCVSISCTEFPGKDIGLAHDIVFFWLALPFGWSASPGYFQTCARVIAKLHCAHRPLSPVTGSFPFISHMFVDDAMIIEVDFPGRLEQSVNARESCCEMLLGAGSVSEDKKRIEGERSESAILLGFHVNVEKKTINLPDANIEGAKLVLGRPCYNTGNAVILLKSLQELRGFFTH